MIFYLENGDKFHLYVTQVEVIYVHFSDALDKHSTTSTRWIGKNAFKEDHMLRIIDFLKSDREGDKAIGKSFLEQTLSINIVGKIVGHGEET